MSDSKIYVMGEGKEIIEHGALAYSHFFAVGVACTDITANPPTDPRQLTRQINVYTDNEMAQCVTITPINACNTTGILLELKGEHFVCVPHTDVQPRFLQTPARNLTLTRIVYANDLKNPRPELPRGLKKLRVYSHCSAELATPTA